MGAPETVRERWLRIDEAFKAVIVNKGGPEECVGRFKTEEIIHEPMPESLRRRVVPSPPEGQTGMSDVFSPRREFRSTRTEA